jgi:hypothetical protein
MGMRSPTIIILETFRLKEKPKSKTGREFPTKPLLEYLLLETGRSRFNTSPQKFALLKSLEVPTGRVPNKISPRIFAS